MDFGIAMDESLLCNPVFPYFEQECCNSYVCLPSPTPIGGVCVGHRLVSSFQVSRLRGAVLKELYLRSIVCTWTGFDEILDSG